LSWLFINQPPHSEIDTECVKFREDAMPRFRITLEYDAEKETAISDDIRDKLLSSGFDDVMSNVTLIEDQLDAAGIPIPTERYDALEEKFAWR
tara:strand:+ start:198 stop:476 length:279 start_codon:yes stop_codon:yes gene_type:complete